MNFLLDFLRQKAPRPGSEAPAYYRNALAVCEQLLIIYFPLCFALLGWLVGRWEIVPVVMFAASLALLLGGRRIDMHANLVAYSAIPIAWTVWFIHSFGWGCSAQHLLIPLLLMIFFDIYQPPWLKIALFLGLITVRMALFSYSLSHTAVYPLEHTASIALQTLNSIVTFITLAGICILFSSNTQATERKLRIDNQTLHKEADTDPLTQLPNRRAMLDSIQLFLETNQSEPFSVAIADIDFFKTVNDTYGHNCGDYTLKTLAELFREAAGETFSVCRWGGEEFLFFLPLLNLDDALKEMSDLCAAVRKMPLRFEGVDFGITITIGVAENDFHSPIQAILDEADQKLYLGKASGRNKVVA